MQLDHIITHEAQLGQQLAQSIANEKPSDFAFLLSLLSNDATDLSVFRLSKSEDSHIKDPLFKQATYSSGPNKPTAVHPFNALIGQHNAAILQTNGKLPLILNECLNPEPLTNKDDSKYIESAIITNCPIATQKKILSKNENVDSNKNIKVSDFYNSIEKSQKTSLKLVA